MSEEIRITSWTTLLEEYFASTGEKAHCLSWIHKQSEALFSKRTTYVDLPSIVLSGVLGFLSVGSTAMFHGNESIASISIGVGSLFVSMLNTIGSYFGWAKRAECHRIASLQYAKLYRFLTIEMSLPREERMSPTELLKLTKETYDRLSEISPLIPPEIIADFRKKFSNDPKYADISFPEETNGLERISVFSDTPSRIPSVSDPRSPLPLFHQKRSPFLTETRDKGRIKARQSTESGFQHNDSTNPLPVVPLHTPRPSLPLPEIDTLPSSSSVAVPLS
jgi:hypothetical protein